MVRTRSRLLCWDHPYYLEWCDRTCDVRDTYSVQCRAYTCVLLWTPWRSEHCGMICQRRLRGRREGTLWANWGNAVSQWEIVKQCHCVGKYQETLIWYLFYNFFSVCYKNIWLFTGHITLLGNISAVISQQFVTLMTGCSTNVCKWLLTWICRCTMRQ